MKIYRLLLLFFCLAFYSCVVDHIEPVKGNIEGYVMLLDRKINSAYQSINNHYGVKVSLEGLTPAIEVLTDTNGHWIMKDVPAGTYNVYYSKKGYESYKQFGIAHVGGKVSTFPYLHDEREFNTNGNAVLYGFPDRLSLFAVETNRVLSLTSKGVSKNTIMFEANTTIKPGEDSYLLCFVNNKGTASYDSYTYLTGESTNSVDGRVSVILYFNSLERFGCKKGETVSMKVYTAPRGRHTKEYSYYDPSIGLRIYTGLSEEGIETKFIMP